MKVPFLREEVIENIASSLLARFVEKFGEDSLPVPVDDIIECCQGLHFEVGDLTSRLGIPDVLGGTWVDEKRVVIDQSLDPQHYPEKRGRYRFTVAHEMGHWELHRFLPGIDARQGLLFTSRKPAIICRRTNQNSPIEWQANAFASRILMPRQHVEDAWWDLRGSMNRYRAKDEIEELRRRMNLDDDEIPTTEIAKDMAKIFEVSGQAMQIRLKEMGLIDVGTDPLLMGCSSP